MGASCLVMAFSAQATLTLTNRNFDASTTLDNPDIPGWFDGNNHPLGFWQDTWLASRSLPSGQSGGTAGLSGDVGGQIFLYQSIGTRNPDDRTLHFSISVGAFTDAASADTKTGMLTAGLYEQTGSFTGADGSDVDGASGIIQVGPTMALPISRVGGPGAVASDETGAFDISGVDTSHSLYLRFKWIPAGASFMSLDNASITAVDSPLNAAPFTLEIKRVVSAATFADGQTRVTVQFAGTPNRIYQIQYSSGMTPGSWSSPAPYFTGPTGTFEASFANPGDVAADWNAHLFFRAVDSAAGGAVLSFVGLRGYVESFNAQLPDETTVGLPVDGSVTAIQNAQASAWMENNVPLFECSDKEIEEIYHFRWWTYRKHIKLTPDGYVITEFLPKVDWSGKYNTIACAAGHHFREGRWIRDSRYLNDYARFWFRKGGDPRQYSFWAADSVYEQALVAGDFTVAIDLLPDLIANYQAWEGSKLDADGLFWQWDGQDGMEVSIGGSGKRATINSYMFGDAQAIAAIANRSGSPEIAVIYQDKARRIQELVLEKLWDDQAKFFKMLPLGVQAVKADVRELHGYTPWYFHLPPQGRGLEAAWMQLTDPQGFKAPFGPTTAEQRHPGFTVSYAGHECQWNGPSWPFATSVTLVALANVLNDYPQDIVSPHDYFETLRTYTASQRLQREDGTVVPWIDEDLNPATGDWISRTRLKTWANGTWDPAKGGVERGRAYNHSTYCDLIITGLVGLRPRTDDLVEVNPLVPEGALDYFCLDNVSYHGRNLTVLWDKTGNRYGRGAGLRVLADGREIAHSETLSRLTGNLNGITP